MGIDFDAAKVALLTALRASDKKVIALVGKWGTGKTHLWDTEVLPALRETADENSTADKKPLYVSLFGVKSVEDLKLKLLDSAASGLDQRQMEVLKSGAATAKELAGKLWPSLAGAFSLKPLLLAGANYMIGNRVVVIDDIERKNPSLDIADVLGFIMEHAERSQTKFVLLLNTARLRDETRWDDLREKVLDVEIVLDPTPSSALAIAAKEGTPCSYLDDVRSAVTVLGINNIRVLRRIIRSVNELLGTDGSRSAAVLKRTVPSVVLLTASYLKAIPDGPPMSFVADYNAINTYLERETDSTPQEVAWTSLMRKLGISSADEFEKIAEGFLSSGAVDRVALDDILSSYDHGDQQQKSFERVSAFFETYLWDGNKSTGEIAAEIHSLRSDVEAMRPDTVSKIKQIAIDIGSFEAGDELIRAWIDHFEKQPNRPSRADPPFSDRSKIDDEVSSAMERWQEERMPGVSLAQATANVYAKVSYGPRELAAFRVATTNTYASTIKALSASELRDFMVQHFEFMNTGGLNADISSALPRFIEACDLIIQTSDSPPRLVEILERETSVNRPSIERIRAASLRADPAADQTAR